MYSILIVDDSSLMRSMIKRIIQVSDFPCNDLRYAENGREGLEVMREHHVDLLVVDINMPVMDGSEMIAAVRADNSISATSVLVISTEGSEK